MLRVLPMPRLFSIAMIVFFFGTFSHAKVLFLAHWNESLNADISASKSLGPVAVNASAKIGAGYAFTNSMPAVNGLTLDDGARIAYNINWHADEGTIDFWFYLRSECITGPQVIQHLFSINVLPGQKHSWANAMFMQYGGWDKTLRVVQTDDKGQWTTSVAALLDKWTANSRWHRIAVSWSKKNRRMSLFIDGRLAARSEDVTLQPRFLPTLYIGSNGGWQGFAPHSYDEFRILDHELTESQAAADFARTIEFTADAPAPTTSMFTPIDLSAVAQTSFTDDQPGDKKGGWTDQGAGNDMRTIPKGRIDAFGVPFVIGDRCIVLSSANRTHYPQEATIPINAKCGGLLFLHTAGFLMAPQRVCGRYVVRYDDNTECDVPLETLRNIADWWYPSDIAEARAALQCAGGGTGQVGACAFFWPNPHGDKTIRSVVFRTENDEAMPILIAITSIAPGLPAHVYRGLQILTHRQSDVEAEFAEAVSTYKQGLKDIPALRADLAKMALTDKQRASFHGRQAQRWLDEAAVYLAECDRLVKPIDAAIAACDVNQTRTLEKVHTYRSRVRSLITEAAAQQALADKATLMTPIAATPIDSPTSLKPLLQSHRRAEIVLNGFWDATTAGTVDACGSEFSPMQIPTPLVGDPILWLRKTLPIPAEWANRRISLNFAGAQELIEIYVNRKFVARHLGIEPFTVDLSDAVTVGATNEILLATFGASHTQSPYASPVSYVTVTHFRRTGITQDLTLCVSPKTAIVDPFAYLDADNTLVLTGTIADPPSKSLKMRIAIRAGNATYDLGSVDITPDAAGTFTTRVKWPKPILWGIGGKYQSPNLAFVTLTLKDDKETIDELTFRTGFRRFDIIDKIHFALNGEKFFLQGDHLWAAESHFDSSTREYITRYYRIARGANFNAVRFHIIEGGNPYVACLDAADELGFVVQPEGCGQVPPTLLNGELNYDDPVYRKNAAVYYRALARKVRTHPSACIVSLSNEVFQSAGRYLDDAARFFLDMEKVVHEEMPHAILTQQGNNWRKEFATADVHYSGGLAFKDWNKRGDRPLIHGEWCVYEAGYFLMNHSSDPAVAKQGEKNAAESLAAEIKLEIASGAAGTMPFPASYMFGFCTSDPKKMGPWAKELLAGPGSYNPNRWYLPHSRGATIDIPWPAHSGRGVRVPWLYTGTQAGNINFFDPSRVEFTPNDVYDAFKNAFLPMPPIEGTLGGEIIVTAPTENAVWPIWATRPNDAALLGVLPDAKGRAWFVLNDIGPVTFTADERSATVELKNKPILQPPGFDAIDRLDLTQSPR